MNSTTRKFTAVLMALAIVVSGSVAFTALSPNHTVEDASPVGESEALAPVVIYGAYLAGSAIGAAAGYVAGDYFGSQDVQKAVDETLQEAVHDEAITSEGANTGFLDNVDNDINTIEGSLEQRISQRFIKNADTYTSETEVISDAEGAASDYLWTTQSNIAETHNFHALSAKYQLDKLDEANASDDYDVIKKVTVSSQSDLDEQLSAGSYSDYSADVPMIITLEGDLNLTGITNDNAIQSEHAPIIINGNGHSITSDATGYTIKAQNEVEVRNASVDTIDTAGYSRTNLMNETSVDTVDDSGSGGAVYIDDTSSVTTNNAGTMSDPVQFEVVNGANVTFNPDDLSTTVPTVEVTPEGSDTPVVLTAVEVNVDPAYSQSDNDTVKLVVPYDADTDTAITANGQSLVIQTSTSGVSDYAEPVNFTRTVDLVEQRDTLSTDAYNYASTFASGVWTDSLEEIATTETTVEDLENITVELGTYTVDVDPENPSTVLNIYAGNYESVTGVADTRLTLTDANGTYEDVVIFSTDMAYLMGQTDDSSVIAEGDTFDVTQSTQNAQETFSGVAEGDTLNLTKTKIETITSATDGSGTDVSSNVNIVDSEIGVIEYTGTSTIDLTVEYDYTQGPNRTFVVNPNDGTTTNLEGSVTVDSVSVDGDDSVTSADIRTFDMNSTDLSALAERLQEQVDTTKETANVDSSGSGIFSDFGSIFDNISAELIVVLILAGGGILVLKD